MKKLLLIITVLATSCAGIYQGQLDTHKAILTDISKSNQSAEDKMDAFMTDFVLFMEESLDITSPKKSTTFVKKYARQNRGAIKTIMDDVMLWQTNMTTLEKGKFALRAFKKPYIKDFVKLAPKFQKKYKHVKFVAQMTRQIRQGLLGILGKRLGNIFK